MLQIHKGLFSSRSISLTQCCTRQVYRHNKFDLTSARLNAAFQSRVRRSLCCLGSSFANTKTAARPAGLSGTASLHSHCTSQKCSPAPPHRPPETSRLSWPPTFPPPAAGNVDRIKVSQGRHLPLLLTPPSTSGLIFFPFSSTWHLKTHFLWLLCFMESNMFLKKSSKSL